MTRGTDRVVDPRQAGEQPPFPAQRQPSPGLESRMTPKPDFGEASYLGRDRLQNRIALITGGDSGIGRAVALAFAREGADIAISYLEEHEDAREIANAVETAGRAVELIDGDLASEEHCRAVIDRAVARYGRIDILVNNAAYQGPRVSGIEEIDGNRVRHTFAVNIVAMFHLVRYALPHMRPGSVVINVSSIQAKQPSFEILDYASTKGAITTFTKGLASELIGRGIRVNAVAPGPVWTPLIAQSERPSEITEFGADSPMGRPAQPAELAPAFVFLASEDARYVTGEILGVTGGRPSS